MKVQLIIIPILALVGLILPTIAMADTNTNNNANTNTNTQSASGNNQNVAPSTPSSPSTPTVLPDHPFIGPTHPGHPACFGMHECPPHLHCPPFCNHIRHDEHRSVIVVHRTIINNHETFTNPSTGTSLPIVFVPGVGFVAPINCKLNSAGDRITCDFEVVQVN